LYTQVRRGEARYFGRSCWSSGVPRRIKPRLDWVFKVSTKVQTTNSRKKALTDNMETRSHPWETLGTRGLALLRWHKDVTKQGFEPSVPCSTLIFVTFNFTKEEYSAAGIRNPTDTPVIGQSPYRFLTCDFISIEWPKSDRSIKHTDLLHILPSTVRPKADIPKRSLTSTQLTLHFN
jgi:hypothetical protein